MEEVKGPDILIIDDDAFSVFSLQTILKTNFNLESDFAYNGEEGIKKIIQKSYGKRNKGTYRLIFMDLNMPIMNGIQAT